MRSNVLEMKRFVGGLWAALAIAGCAAGGGTGPAAPSAPPRRAAPAAEPPHVVAAEPPRPVESTPPAVVAAPEGGCDPFADLTERKEGDLTVPVEPRPSDPSFLGRMRHHSEGSLSVGAERVWFGPRVPRPIPLHDQTSELHLLEKSGDGWVAVYRDPYGAGSCSLGDRSNCRVVITGFERCGQKLWSHDLRRFMSAPNHLEVQDVRVADGIVYFNEACQSYARDAAGRCSALVAFDPVAGRTLWRTANLVSNNRILVVGAYLVAGYGFTAEADHVSLVRRKDGKVTSRQPLPHAHEDLTLAGDGTLVVRTYPGDRFETFTLSGLDGDAAKLTPRRASPKR